MDQNVCANSILNIKKIFNKSKPKRYPKILLIPVKAISGNNITSIKSFMEYFSNDFSNFSIFS